MLKELFAKAREGQPFAQPIEETLSSGMKSEVRVIGKDWVVKTLRPYWKYGDWENNLISDVRLLQQYLGNFIPPTYFVYGGNYHNRRDLLLVQKRLHNAKHLKDATALEIGEVREQLDEFIKKVLSMQDELQRSPDLHGGFHPLLFTMYNLQTSNNILIDAENHRVWLVDLDMKGWIFEKNIIGRLHTRFMRYSIQRFRKNSGFLTRPV